MGVCIRIDADTHSGAAIVLRKLPLLLHILTQKIVTACIWMQTIGLQHPHALVADDEFHAVQPAPAESLGKFDPVGLLLLHILGSA